MQLKNHRKLWSNAVVLCLTAALTLVAAPDIEAATKWNLDELYPDNDAWQQARDTLPALVEQLQPLKGALGDDPENLLQALDLSSKIMRRAYRLYTYASLSSDLDNRESGPRGMKQALLQQFAQLSAASAWIDPEILGISQETIAGFLGKEPGLERHRRRLEQLEKMRTHTLDAQREELMSMTGMIQGAGGNVSALLRSSEIPWTSVTLEDGTEIKVDSTGYSKGRASSNRLDRFKTYEAFYSTLHSFEGTLASCLATTVQEHVFTSRVRGYENTLQAAVKPDEVDPAVYHMLVDQVNAGLPTLHRYLKLRARMLGLSDLGYHDLYPPLVEGVERAFTWDKAVDAVLAALAPLGAEYTNYLKKAVDQGWVDVYPRTGKPGGAYVSGRAYDVHPFMLLNHQDTYEDTSTFAHEGGHMMHSALSSKAQPFETAFYETFVAEVASTTNEWLFFRHNLANAASDDERLAILGSFLESIRTTVFRQTMFAEFELAMHQMAENGQPITSDSLNDLYLGLLRTYHGHDAGVCRIDEKYAVEWAFIPHFHYDYYVYTYATSFIAGNAFSERIAAGPEGAERYIEKLLKAGSSKPPVEILEDAGVDMTTAKPFQAIMKAMNDVMDQIETILDSRQN